MNWEPVVSILSHPIVTGTAFAVAGLLFAGFKKYKKAIKEIVDIPRAVIKARGSKSPGGKSITEKEYADIGKEIVEAVESSAVLYKLLKK